METGMETGTSVSMEVGVGGIISLVVFLVVCIIAIAGCWKVFAKAGKPGWGILIPIYNIILLLEIAGKPLWWVILMFIPLVNIIIIIIVSIELAKNFGKGTGFGIGLALLGFIFYPILGFGDARYMSSAAPTEAAPEVEAPETPVE